MKHNESILFCGQSSERLGKRMETHFKGTMGVVDHTQFPSGEWYCQLKNNIRGADVFLLNSITKPANESLMQLCIMADAARRASAGRITAVIPCFGYQRQDRKDKSRVPISAKLVMNILEAAGFHRVVTMDLHAAQIQGMTDLPVDHLQFRPALTEALPKVDVVVAPDVGGMKRAEEYAKKLDVDLAIVTKRRKNATTVEATQFIGDVEGKDVLIVDDLTESAGTLITAAGQCKSKGANKVFAAVTHECITEIGVVRLLEAFQTGTIDHFYVSNTVQSTVQFAKDFMTVVNVAPVFAKAINSIHNNESVSSLFI